MFLAFREISGRGDLLGTVDDDVLGHDAFLQHAHLWVGAAASEQARGLDLEVAYFFFMVIHDAPAVFLGNSRILLFDFLLTGNCIIVVTEAYDSFH